jgi:RHS repeat-associated protein
MADRDAWGWTTITSAFPADEIPFEFPGQLRLDGTEFTRLVSGPSGCLTETVQPALVSNGYRDYDPVAGIYLTRDPISRLGSNWAASSANRNLYSYAGFSPIDRFDYWGLETPSGFDDGGSLFVSFIPILGPGLGMRDAIVEGDWAMAVINASFLVLDITSLGSASMARAAGTGAVRAALSAEGRYVARGVALATARNEIAAVGRRSCEAAARGGEEIAEGAHTVFRREAGDTGRVSHYETLIPQTNSRNPAPWESVKRFDATGKGHFNKATQEVVPTPHVHDPTAPGGVREPSPDEIPFGWL